MRFDTPVYFQTVTPGEYDATTGDYGPESVSEEQRWASVTNSGIETLRLVYGEIKQDSLTIRLQNHVEHPFDRIRIGTKLYKVDFHRPLRKLETFVVSGVQ